MKTLPLSQGKVAIVDDDVYEWASKFKWSARRTPHTWYAVRIGPRPRRPNFYLHCAVLPVPDGFEVDHINHDGLDCRRANLRQCRHGQNLFNQRKRSGTTSRFKGVSIYRKTMQWQASAIVDGRSTSLGRFAQEEDAARAYDAAARANYGEFALTNFPEVLA